MASFHFAKEAPPVVIRATATTTVVQISPASGAPGASTTLTATVSPIAAAGTVQFFDGGTAIGAAVNVVSGQASLMAQFALGTHPITAVFTPTAPVSFVSSTSAPVNYTASQSTIQTSTTLAIAPASPVVAGTSITFTATVTPTAAAGSVQFHDGATLIGTRAVTNGTASMSMSTLSQGQHFFSATFLPTNTAAYIDSTSPTSAGYQINPTASPTMARAKAFLANRAGDIEGLAAGELTGYDLVICNPSYSSQLASLKTANPNTKFLLYRNEIACPNGNSDGLMSVSYVDANANHPDWFLTNTVGTRLVLSDQAGTAPWMDQSVLGYQNQWATNAIALCQSQGWHGVFIDDHNSHFNTHLGGSQGTVRTNADGSAYTETDNRLASKAFALNVCSKVRAAGYYTLANVSFTSSPVGSTWQQAFTDLGGQADGNMREFWAYSTNVAGGSVFVTGNFDYQQQQMVYGLGLGRGFFPLTYVNSSAIRDYAWSSFQLLLTGSSSAWMQSAITNGGDPGIVSGYGVSVGSKTAVPGSPNCYYRDFPGGTLYVNADTVTHTLGGVTVLSGNSAFVATPVGAAWNPVTYDWASKTGPVSWLNLPVVTGSRTITASYPGLTGAGTLANPYIYDGSILGGNFRMDTTKNVMGSPLTNNAGQMATVTVNCDYIKFKNVHSPYWFTPAGAGSTVHHHITWENCSSGIYDYFQTTAPTTNKFTGAPLSASGVTYTQYWWEPQTRVGYRWAPGDTVWSYAGETWTYIQFATPTAPSVGESWAQMPDASAYTVANYFRWNGSTWVNINSSVDPAVVGPNDGGSIAGWGCAQASDLFWNKCIVQGWEDGIYCGDNPHFAGTPSAVTAQYTPPRPKSVNHKVQLTWFIGASLSRGKRDPHADLFQSTGVVGLTIQRNRFDGGPGKWGYTGTAQNNRYNACMILKTDMSRIDDALVSENLIYSALFYAIYSVIGNYVQLLGGTMVNGNPYVLDTSGPRSSPTNMRFRNNVFDNSTRAIIVEDDPTTASPPYVYWTGNKQLDGTLVTVSSPRITRGVGNKAPTDDGDPTGEGLFLA